MCEYTGHHCAKIESLVKNNGGKLHFDVTFLQRNRIASGVFFLDNDNLRLSAEGSLFSSLTEMYITLHECGYGVNNSNGANTDGGNAANCISGNFSLFGNIVTELGVLSQLLCSEITINITKPAKAIKPKVLKAKDFKVMKANNRIMRPVNAMKGEGVWKQEYINLHNIDLNRCYELWGDKNKFYAAMTTMTVLEFETTYGIRSK